MHRDLKDYNLDLSLCIYFLDCYLVWCLEQQFCSVGNYRVIFDLSQILLTYTRGLVRLS